MEQATTTTAEITISGREADILLGITRSRRRALVRRGDLIPLRPIEKPGQAHVFSRAQVVALKRRRDAEAQGQQESCADLTA